MRGRLPFGKLVGEIHNHGTIDAGGWEPDCAFPRNPFGLKYKPGYSVGQATMSDVLTRPRTKVKAKTERPRLHKVILLNDHYTPREFVVAVLKAVFRMTEDQAHRVMMTAHQRGACVVAVYTKDTAESKAKQGTESGRSKGYPLMFTTEPEE